MMARARQMAVPVIVAGLEVTWVYGLLTVAAGIAGMEVRASWLLVLFVVSGGLSATLHGLRVRGWAALAVSWMAWAAVTLVAIKVLLFADSHWSDPIWLTALPAGLAGVLGRFDPVLLICCGSALVWWLGRRLAYMRPGFARVVGEFQFGLVLLATTFSLAYLLDREPADAIAVGLTYVTLGLVGAAVAQGGDGQEGRLAFRQQGSWWGMLLVSVTAILVLGLLVGAIITPDFVHLMVRGLAWLWRQVDGVLMAIADRFASEPLGPSPGTVVSTTTTTGIAAETLGFGFSLPGWLTGGARLVWTMLVAGMGLLAVWRVASYLFGRMSGLPANGGGEVERLKGAFRLDMAAWFKRTVTRLLGLGRRRAGRGPVETPSTGAVPVREVYRRLLHWAAGSGLVREVASTPHEFECLLVAALPEHAEQFRAITREYVKARYGGVAPSDEEMDIVKHAWRSVRKG